MRISDLSSDVCSSDLGMSEDLKLYITGVAAGRSKFYNADNQDPIFGIQKGYVKLDLRIQLADRDENWHLALVGKNLTNELTTGSAFRLPAPNTGAERALLYLEPTRNLTVVAGFTFLRRPQARRRPRLTSTGTRRPRSGPRFRPRA